ncbi:hypothetical protein N8128_01590 [Paracoccaceae bacterium]|jgi:hypothetical protein|nr:hypothetical protein [Paracoccaceae bacterium]
MCRLSASCNQAQSKVDEARKAHPRERGSRGLRLGPQAFSTGGVDSLV